MIFQREISSQIVAQLYVGSRINLCCTDDWMDSRCFFFQRKVGINAENSSLWDYQLLPKWASGCLRAQVSRLLFIVYLRLSDCARTETLSSGCQILWVAPSQIFVVNIRGIEGPERIRTFNPNMRNVNLPMLVSIYPGNFSLCLSSSHWLSSLLWFSSSIRTYLKVVTLARRCCSRRTFHLNAEISPRKPNLRQTSENSPALKIRPTSDFRGCGRKCGHCFHGD